MFVDSHCHLEMEEYDKDREAVVARAATEDVCRMLTVGTEEKYFSTVKRIVETYDNVYGAVGLHPHNAAAYSDAFEKTLKGFFSLPKIVACGEIGLDFYRNYAPRDAQVKAFGEQIALGREAGLPLIIHSRNAREETLGLLREMNGDGHPTVIHCYSYDLDTAKRLLEMGYYLSIPGTVTYKNAPLTDVVRYVPLDRLLSETDAPYLTPTPMRGKRNEPAFVRLTVEAIARIKAISVEETALAVSSTFERLFLTKRPERRQ
jgi:TatD DNase family protein